MPGESDAKGHVTEAKQVAEKLGTRVKSTKGIGQGLKLGIDFIACVCGTTEVVPCYKEEFGTTLDSWVHRTLGNSCADFVLSVIA
jgi:hypothetical protein